MADTPPPITRPVNVARDLSVSDIRDVDFSLFDLFAAEMMLGRSLVEGKTVTGCRIQGPAVLLASTGVTFDGVNFGDSGGDIRNLIMKPEGSKAIGAIPFRDCAFVNCEFYGVGFTGDAAFLEQIRALQTLSLPVS
ncbi:hypothetical protein [Brevundimonas variabilis]|uniref:Uncharacterized protein n=1 Tax=Brevundimonas variabilis TaxID=74312 RepID=A0A7W9CKP4_9CAUL|nr:hypothetical protein [Brevundimonas variabilis]MBB5747331.1 hypothetical protein [Brevundimonas variabilis]